MGKKSQDLLEAARNGKIAVVNKILEQYSKKSGPLSSFRRSPSINGQDINGYTPLHHACLNGHYEIVRLLLIYDAAIDVSDIRGSTPLYLASWAGHYEIVKLLLSHPVRPANPNAQTLDNETPLHCAAQHGYCSIVAILLTYGADPTVRNNSFQTALDLAAQFGRLQAVQTLLRTHPELIESLRFYDEMENGHATPYTITPTKHIFTHTCLHLAARNGHKKVVEALLAAGVNVNLLTHNGTALHEAALCGKKSVVYTLLKSGVDPTAVDGQGRSALDVLKDYPPHVTYEIASIIKGFCFDSQLMDSKTHFVPIKEVSEDAVFENKDSKENTIHLTKKNFDSNNNNWVATRMVPVTPEIPPPSVSEAENTIFEFVKPPDDHIRRRSFHLEDTDPHSLNDLKSFIWEGQKEPREDQAESLSSSRVSECVEEFVSEVPFAGLFKGSSLNLASNSQLNSSVEDLSVGLRSPKLVRATVKTKRVLKVKETNEQKNVNNDLDFDAVKAWEEIQTIFECIGNEVKKNDKKLITTSRNDEAQAFLHKKTLSIRKPAELLLKSNNSKQKETNSNWCHSNNILIYGSLTYKVFYLGSTVIRELHGTASTRKSIQRLKRGETPILSDNEESSLIKDINSSTRILKETNQQTRLEVGIALSHTGVRFVDVQTQNTISVHDIENINCVCQDPDDLRYFAYITWEDNIHYCHVFMVDNVDLATEIILTLGQAFEVAYQLSIMNQQQSIACSSYIDIVDNI
ncbi:ankyrin repeat and sterile alpha motif domain-containing protein 1B isoform X2 [Glossina fuscipes]|uniref:Ankyrin repeat and sterile alpha motif domain-containing protein 1B isoform X2 n=1 Tax=Glossina fuscipes TaxID=7396 RepID=A0A8U0WFF7_9MUSC|nr:ankyrin repeat and sterile alpha motif domain-containing protein 1B isoform X2 [Glossina fuscipes]